MKIQYLAVIFIIIIMPIVIVFSEYMNTQMTIASTEKIYDSRLLDSTYDAIKSFQINTINTTYYTPQIRVDNLEGAVNTFFNSLVTSFRYDGNKADSMKQYIPAIVFTSYDGYYVYSPFENTLTGLKEEVDNKYEDRKILNGLKPYVSYSCRYKYNGKDYVITYSLDNYVTVDVFDANKHYRKEGYLLNVAKGSGNSYKYGGITFTQSDKEQLSEILPQKSGNSLVGRRYYYTIRDGTKYYYKGNNSNIENNRAPNVSTMGNDTIFYLNNNGEQVNQVNEYKSNKKRFEDYYDEIRNNITGYQYYKEAYEFTTWLLTDQKIIDVDGDGTLDKGENLQGLTTANIVDNSPNYAGYKFANVGNIFNLSNIEDSDSNFNRHRADVIRAVITTNLSTAISGFSKYSNSGEEFVMPKISETDWELLENNICIATFLQGIRIGGKEYNNYSVVPNNFNKEFVDESDIYIIKNDNTYAKANDLTITDSTIHKNLRYQPGVLKINFENRRDSEGNYYNSMSYQNANISYGYSPYLLSYTSISGSSKISNIATSDMYKYMRQTSIPNSLKKAYFIALGRERKGAFKYTINNIEN